MLSLTITWFNFFFVAAIAGPLDVNDDYVVLVVVDVAAVVIITLGVINVTTSTYTTRHILAVLLIYCRHHPHPQCRQRSS